MTANDLISELTSRGVVLMAEGDRITFDAPAGAITDRDLAQLRQHKAAILDALTAGEAGRLIADLRAAGCGFILDDGELRLSLTAKISTALWARFEALADDDDFLGMAYREAKRATYETASAMIN